jgi:hypothetical protein
MSRATLLAAAGELASGRPYAERADREPPWHDRLAESLLGAVKPAFDRLRNPPHDVPLSDPAIALLRAMPQLAGRDPVFGSGANGLGAYSIPKKALDKRITAANGANGEPMAPWVIHDLRRTCATHMAEIGIAPNIIEATLNHTSGHKAGVAGIYNRAAYEREKRQALDLWAEHVMAAVNTSWPQSKGKPPITKQVTQSSRAFWGSPAVVRRLRARDHWR